MISNFNSLREVEKIQNSLINIVGFYVSDTEMPFSEKEKGV